MLCGAYNTIVAEVPLLDADAHTVSIYHIGICIQCVISDCKEQHKAQIVTRQHHWNTWQLAAFFLEASTSPL